MLDESQGDELKAAWKKKTGKKQKYFRTLFCVKTDMKPDCILDFYSRDKSVTMKRLLDIQKNTQNILKYKQKVNTQRSS